MNSLVVNYLVVDNRFLCGKSIGKNECAVITRTKEKVMFHIVVYDIGSHGSMLGNNLKSVSTIIR